LRQKDFSRFSAIFVSPGLAILSFLVENGPSHVPLPYIIPCPLTPLAIRHSWNAYFHGKRGGGTVDMANQVAMLVELWP
jgi:hypothetical protein